MKIKEFENMLSKSHLSKKKFSQKTKLPYQTIMNWKRNNNVPSWVESWLENYIKSKSYEDVKTKVFEIEGVKKEDDL